MIPAHDSPVAAMAFNSAGTKLSTASEKVRISFSYFFLSKRRFKTTGMTVSLSDILEGHKNISCVLLTSLKRKQKNYPSLAHPRSDNLKKLPLSDTNTYTVACAKQYSVVEFGKDSITRHRYVMNSTDRLLDVFF